MTLSPKLGVVEISTIWHFKLPLPIEMFIKVASSPRLSGIGMPSPILWSYPLKMQGIVLLSSLLWWELGTNSLITGPGEWLSFRRFTSKLSWSWSWFRTHFYFQFNHFVPSLVTSGTRFVSTFICIRVVSTTIPFAPESFRPLSISPRVVSPRIVSPTFHFAPSRFTPNRFVYFSVRPCVVSPTFLFASWVDSPTYKFCFGLLIGVKLVLFEILSYKQWAMNSVSDVYMWQALTLCSQKSEILFSTCSCILVALQQISKSTRNWLQGLLRKIAKFTPTRFPIFVAINWNK